MAQLATAFATIAAGESLSDAADCEAGRPVRILMPEAWDGAQLSFQVSIEGTDFYDLYDADGREVTLVCHGGNRSVVLPGSAAIAVAFVKIRSGSTEYPVKQSAERKFRITMDATVTRAT